MTVTCTNTKHVYPADGKRNTWPFTFPLFNAQDLRLWRVGTDGKACLKTSGFYVDMLEKEVQYPLSTEEEPVPAAGEYIVLQRVTPLTQEFDVKRQQTLDLQTWEDAHDLSVMRQQELAEELSRALKFPVHCQPADTDAQAYLAAITQLKEEAQTLCRQALQDANQAQDQAQQAAEISAQAVQQAQDSKQMMAQYASSAQEAEASAVQAKTQAQTASVQAQDYAHSCQQANTAVQTAAQTAQEQSQQALSSAQSAQQNAQTAQQAAQNAQTDAQSAAQSAQSAAQSASAINPSTYVQKQGDTVTGDLCLQNANMAYQNSHFAQGDIPQTDVYLGLRRGVDKNNKNIIVDYNYIGNTSGNVQYIKRMWQNRAGSNTYRDVMSASYTPAGVSVVSFEKNNQVKSPTPAASSNGTDIATTAWVRNLITTHSLMQDYLTQRYRDDKGNWYEVYSSGWVRQGIVLELEGNYGVFTVSLLKAMASANYTVQCTRYTANANAGTQLTVCEVGAITATDMKLVLNNNNAYAPYVYKIFVLAEGQGA